MSSFKKMERQSMMKALVPVAAVALLGATLAGCGGGDCQAKSAAPVSAPTATSPAPPTTPPGATP